MGLFIQEKNSVKKQKTIDIDNNMESSVVALKKLFQVKTKHKSTYCMIPFI